MLEYYLWKTHVGHQLEARAGTRSFILGEDEREGQEETIVVYCSTCESLISEYGHDVAIRWSVEDVQSCATLSQGEAEIVLEEMEHDHDAGIGVNWDVMGFVISRLFPEAVFLGAEEY